MSCNSNIHTVSATSTIIHTTPALCEVITDSFCTPDNNTVSTDHEFLYIGDYKHCMNATVHALWYWVEKRFGGMET